MFCTDLPPSRRINGIEVLGPDFFARDESGQALGPIAVVFPNLLLLVTGRGIHAELICIAEAFLRARCRLDEQRDLTAAEERELYESVIPLMVRESTVLIRSFPDDMARVFAADELLQRLLPKPRIQFTGIHNAAVREQLRRRGESWRISPAPRSSQEIYYYIRACRVHVNTNAIYYQNAQSGERFLTYEEFQRIRPLLRKAPQKALCRLKEIHHLSQLVNDQGVPELSFFLPADTKLTTRPLGDIIAVLQNADSPQDLARAEVLFDFFALSYAVAAGDELTIDGERHTAWQTTMYCRLYDLNEKTLEEWMLRLSPEFHLNMRWLPGARLKDGEVLFESTVESKVRSLINYFVTTWPGIVSINVGRVESPLTNRDRTEEEREVYLVVLGLPEGREEIRLLRMIKWDVRHRLKQGFPLSQAIRDTVSYRDYILDRLRAAATLKIPMLSYTAIQFEEELEGVGTIPIFFFDRRYVEGMVTDKIPLSYYGKNGFIVRLARLLGVAAAASMVLGRASHRTQELFFDDGDEVIQLDQDKLPERLVISETTGSFTDSTTPVRVLLSQCLKHLAAHLAKARRRGVTRADLKAAVEAFSEGLAGEIERMQALLQDPSMDLRSLFANSSAEPGSVRARWDNMLNRLAATEVAAIREAILISPELAGFMES